LLQTWAPAPGIASEWNISDDFQTYTFRLLQGGVKTLAGYEPTFSGPFSAAQSGIRTAHFV